MNTQSFIFSVMFAGLLGASASHGDTGSAATPPPRLTLVECVAIALDRATSVANAGRDEQIAEATIAQTKSQLLPQLNLEGTYTRLDKLTSLTFNDTSYTMGSLDTYGTAATVSQLLYNGGQVSAATVR